jgi:hypothetical protein
MEPGLNVSITMGYESQITTDADVMNFSLVEKSKK